MDRLDHFSVSGIPAPRDTGFSRTVSRPHTQYSTTVKIQSAVICSVGSARHSIQYMSSPSSNLAYLDYCNLDNDIVADFLIDEFVEDPHPFSSLDECSAIPLTSSPTASQSKDLQPAKDPSPDLIPDSTSDERCDHCRRRRKNTPRMRPGPNKMRLCNACGLFYERVRSYLRVFLIISLI